MPSRITACGSGRASTRMNLWLDSQQLERLQEALAKATGLEASRTVVVRRALDLLDDQLSTTAANTPAFGYQARRDLERTKR